MDRLHSMKIFARVADAGSFSAAARDLGLSKAAVSKQALAFTFDSFGTFYDKYVVREAIS